MAVDPYAMCPCGSGKKLKFCCSDLVGEIEKIHRMIEGEQPRAALRHVEQTLATHPNRASLLDLKATLELSLGEIDAAKDTVAKFVATNSDSPTAFACQALLQSELRESKAAIESLQKALSMVEREMPLRVYEALGAVGGACLETGHILGAQAHLWLHAALAPKEDARAREVLAALNHYSGLPLILRDQLRFRPWPKDAAWSGEAEKASRLADHGKWQQAAAAIDRLGAKYGAEPTLLFNRALLGGWLADDRALVGGLHAFAQMDVPLDDAVEAEAIAQLLDADLKEPRLDSVVQSYEIKNLDELVPRLISDKRVQAFEMDPEMFADRDQPRPRHTYVLLDRPMPESGVGITRDAVPRLAGVMAIYGRQTDRPERLELTIDKGPAFESAVGALKQIAGDTLGEVIEEKVIGTVSPSELALNWRWHPPRDTPAELRRTLADEERRAAIVERWPTLKQPVLGGKSPKEAAGDAELRIPLMASVLVLEQGTGSDRDAESIAELRRDLNLPQPETIDPAGQPINALPLVRVPRLEMDSVSDDDLAILYRRAILVGAQVALLKLAREAVRRPSIAELIPPTDAYQRLVAAERDSKKALALIQEAREHTQASAASTATWDLAELELHITSGNVDQAKELLARIERDHRDDPQVAAALYQLLYETGVISDQMPMQPRGHSHTHEAAPALAGAAAEPAAGKIWTPGSDRPASGGGKSALWTPS
jgi:tetratricopeptide (TPR) repeat protein